MTTIKTPAQKLGIVVGVTKLKLSNNGEYSQSDLSQTWILSDDDGTYHPFFKVAGGDDQERIFAISNMVEVVESVTPAEASSVRVIGHFKMAEKWEHFFKHESFNVITKVPTETGEGYKGLKEDGTDYHVLNEYWEFYPIQVAITIDMPQIPSAAPSQYTALQQTAINVFQAMYDAAVAYRNGESTTLNPDYGICDNIDRFARAHDSSESPMSEVKENLIRQTEIYSGNYTYPVPCPDGGDASNAFSRHGNKWNGPYGLNRLIQLGQLIALIKSDKWDDSMVRRKTPAFRNGLTVGDMVVFTRRTEPSYWVLRRDDESMSPSFHRIGDPDDYADLDLNYVKKVDKAQLKERTVAQFLEELKAKQEEQDAINKQIAELQAALAVNKCAIALLDFGLAQQHKVKRIA